MATSDRAGPSISEQASAGHHSVSLDTHVQNLLTGNIISLYELGKSHNISMEEVPVNVPMVKPSPALLAILKEMGTEWEIFTLKEVAGLLKDYIIKQNLYSPQDPRIVVCDKDPLSKALGVKKFTLFDVKKLIEMNSYPLPDYKTTKRQQLVARPKNSDPGKRMQFITISCPKYLDMKVFSPETLGTADQPQQSAAPTQPPVNVSQQMQEKSHPLQGGSTSVIRHPATTVPSGRNTSETHESQNTGMANYQQNNTDRRQQSHQNTQLGSRKNTQGQTSHTRGHFSSQEPRRERQASLSINLSDSENGPFQVSLQLQDSNSSDEQDGEEGVVSFDVDADQFRLEYEVVSDDDDIISSTASVSGISESGVVIICGDSDMEFWADSSENEMIEEDKWTCKECGMDNLPLIGRCSGCTKERPDWLSDKCRRRRLERTASRDRAFISSSECEEAEIPHKRQHLDNHVTIMGNHVTIPNMDSDLHDNDSGMGTLPSSQESVITTKKSNINESELTQKCVPLNSESHDLGTYRSLLNYQQNLLVGSELSSAASRDEGSTACSDKASILGSSTMSKSEVKNQEQIVGKCIICFDRVKNASIIHGCTGHQACCYRCAKKLKRLNKPCPMCRRPIQKIIRNFIVR